MRKNYWIILALGFCLGLLLTTSGCDIRIPGWHRAKYERTVQQQVPLAPGSTLVAKTKLGSITITGADVADCNVIAIISASAPTEQEAAEIAKQVAIKLEPVDKTLTVRAEKPHLKRNRSIGVSFKITVPRQTNIDCASSHGSIELMDLNGNVKGKSSSGSAKGYNIQGSTELETSYGSVTGKNISGDNIKLKSSSGSITAENIRGSTQLETSYGSITCKDISNGDIKLKTSSGKITLSKVSVGDCDVRTSYGSISADELLADSIKIESGSGGIKVIKASADTANVSTSYGRITCQQIKFTDLTTKSGSGNIDVAFSESAPAEITANIETSYGNIDFITSPNFSGEVSLSTSYGSVKTDLPITIIGEVSKKKLAGRIGEGKGKLYLRTSSGSIKIR